MANTSKYLVIFGASNVTGTRTRPIITPSDSIENLRIEGMEYDMPIDYSDIVATINGQSYTVDSNGFFELSMPDFGFLSKEDKLKLNDIDPDSYAPKASPAFTGTPTAPTAAAGNNTTQIATTAYVDRAVANIDLSNTSSNDYTNEEKSKLAGIEAGAQVNTVTGVKGSAEASYRTGNIEITKANIGLSNVENTADSAKIVASANKLTTAVGIKIASSDGSDPGSSVNFDGSSVITFLLPSTIKANLIGQADSAINDTNGDPIADTYLKSDDAANTYLGIHATADKATADAYNNEISSSYIRKIVAWDNGAVSDMKDYQVSEYTTGNIAGIGTADNAQNGSILFARSSSGKHIAIGMDSSSNLYFQNGTQSRVLTVNNAISSLSFSGQTLTYTKENGSTGTVNIPVVANTDQSVKQDNSTTNTAYPILLKNGTGTGSTTTSVLFASGITVNPSTSTITATHFNGTASAAEKDGSDHTIATYFAPLSSPSFTGTPTTASTPAKNDSSTKLATTAYVDRAVSDLINGAPAALDTLKEISDIIGDSNSITGSIISNIASKQASSTALTSIAGLVTAANQMIYTTAANTYSTTSLGATGKSLLAASSAAVARSTIGAIDSTATVASAVSDNANHVISSTYLTKTDASTTYATKTAAISSISGNGSSTTISYTKADGTTGSFTTKDTVYTLPKATTSALGGVIIGSNITLDTSTGKISLSSSNVTSALGYTPPTADTHYETKLIVGTSTATGMAAATNGNVYLRLFDNSTIRQSIKVTGAGITSVTSDSAGTITVSTTGYSNATTSVAGLLSATDKAIIDGIASTYATKGSAISSISGDGSSTIISYTKADGTTGSFNVPYDTVVRMDLEATNANYLLPFRTGTVLTSDPSGDYAIETLGVNYGITVNPSTKTITATNFNGTATKATQDESGNNIKSTYVKSVSINASTGVITVTKGNDQTNTFTVATTNTDVNVKQEVKNNVNTAYPILFKNGTGTGTVTTSVLFDDGITINPSTNTITATYFEGTATKASKDDQNRVISSTYLTTSDASSTYAVKGSAVSSFSVNGKTITYTKADGTTGNFTTQDTVYTLPKATTSALGGIIVGSNITLDTSTGKISLSSGNVTSALGYTPPTADTHYETKLIAGTSTSTGMTAATNGNVYLRLFDNSTVRQSIKITGAGRTAVTSDSAGTITVSTTAYSNATTSADGLLSATDKSTLDTLNSNYVAKANVVTSVTLSGTTVTVNKAGGGSNNFTVATSNTDSAVKQTNSTANTAYPILLKNGTGSGETTTSAIFASGVTITPSTGTLTVSHIAGTTATFSGTMTLTKTQDLSGSADSKPALIVGGASTAAHIEIDPNEIQAKTNGTSTATLYINNDGGLVQIGSGGLSVNGTITANSFSGTATSATSAGSATKATQDESGNNIKATYVKSVSLSGSTVTVTKGNDSSTTFTVSTTDANVKQESNAGNAAYPVFFKTSTATTTATTSVYFNSKVTINPSTGTLSATTIAGSLAASYLTGTLGVDHGGTGVTSNPSMLTNLGSTTAASVFATSPRPGITGTLGVANGGTGQTSIANIQAGKDSAGNTISTTYATKATAVTGVAIANGILSKTINGSTTYTNVILPYGNATETAIAKTVAISNFTLATGARITVKFTNNGVAGNCTLNVNGTGAKNIYYRGYQLPGDALQANTTLDLVYNGTQWEIVGSFFWTV